MNGQPTLATMPVLIGQGIRLFGPLEKDHSMALDGKPELPGWPGAVRVRTALIDLGR